MRQTKLEKMRGIFLFVVLLVPLVGGETGCHLPQGLTQHCTCQDSMLSCRNLTTTSSLQALVLPSVNRVTILHSSIQCVNLADLTGLAGLRELQVSHSHLHQALCKERRRRHKKSAELLLQLEHLDLSHNSLTSLDQVGKLRDLKYLNISHNAIENLPDIFSSLEQLQVLDVSHNRLNEELDQTVFTGLPSTLQFISITGNPWPCSPSLSWLYPWSLQLSTSARMELGGATCQIENTSRVSPLLKVMETYHRHVVPQCPQLCSCHFYHFASNQGPDPVYTVLVNCSDKQLKEFPSLPQQTTILDLSNNKLSDKSYFQLDVLKHNYQEVSGLHLSNNRFKSLDNKLLKLKLQRYLHADRNYIQEFPYDLSLKAQRHEIKLSLGNNPWACGCNSEINNSNLKQRIVDANEIVCGEKSLPDSIVGLRLNEVDPIVLCPSTDEGEQRELVLEILCATLALLIVVILTKLLLDYWRYRTKGTLPWIVLKMP